MTNACLTGKEPWVKAMLEDGEYIYFDLVGGGEWPIYFVDLHTGLVKIYVSGMLDNCHMDRCMGLRIGAHTKVGNDYIYDETDENYEKIIKEVS